MKIRYSEIFTSFQGEAEFTGQPSVWVRLFGCNLQCNGFGQDDPTKPASLLDLPYKTIDISSITRMVDLPVFDKGCDSGYSWSSKFKGLATVATGLQIAARVRMIAREELGLELGSWYHPVTKQPVQLCFTGGEPMLNQKAMLEILDELVQFNEGVPLPQITIETNGTKKADPLIFGEIRKLVDHVHFAISPKLYHVSGEKKAVKLDVIDNLVSESETVAIKYVHNGRQEAWDELDSYQDQFKKWKMATFWIMPVGATIESQSENTVADIAREAMKRGFNVAARVHCYVFGNKMST